MSLTIALAALIALAGLAMACRWFVITIELAPVSRGRLERFARLQRLPVTATNGDLVIRYLATTRRWRAAGLAVGLLASLGWAAVHSRIGVNSLSLFAGWFAGALIAEIRLLPISFGHRRSALLSPRRAEAYLPPAARVLPWACSLLSLGIGLITLTAAIRGQRPAVAGGAWFAAAMAVTAAGWLMRRKILGRAQPATAPDVMAADDAIRSRSLHVLAGASASLVLYAVLGQLSALAPMLTGTPRDGVSMSLVAGNVAVPLLGWLIASSPWPVRREIGTGNLGAETAGDAAP